MLSFLMGGDFTAPLTIRDRVEGLPSSEQQQLQARLDALELAFAGLWRLLKAQGLADDQLVKAMEEADLADGKRDGKISPVRAQCPSCGHKVLSQRSPKCLWCGADLPPRPQ